MKLSGALLMSASLLLGLPSLAEVQSSSSQKSMATAEPDFSAKGVRVSLFRPALNIKASGPYRDESALNDAYGISVGYAYLPINQVGYTANFSLIPETSVSTREGLVLSASFSRFDGNVGTAINEYLNVKAGANLSNVTISDGAGNSLHGSTGFGFQASVGVEINPHFGFDVGYVQMAQKLGLRNTLDGKKANVNLTEAGPEISLHGTF